MVELIVGAVVALTVVLVGATIANMRITKDDKYPNKTI